MEQYSVTGMSCAACSSRVEKAVSKVPGVTSCSVSLLTNSMGVEGTATSDAIISAVEAAGYHAEEAERVRKVLKDSAYTIALAIDGKQMTSENFAEKIQGLGIRGESHICFLIGGSLGMSDSLLRQADERISFSKMTFPHQLMRVILLEQIYRGFRIIHHEPYHK